MLGHTGHVLSLSDLVRTDQALLKKNNMDPGGNEDKLSHVYIRGKAIATLIPSDSSQG